MHIASVNVSLATDIENNTIKVYTEMSAFHIVYSHQQMISPYHFFFLVWRMM